MAINIEKIMEQTGETKEEIALAIQISIEELNSYIDGSRKPKAEIYGKLSSYTGLTYEQLELGVSTSANIVFDVNDTWSPSKESKKNLEMYLEEGLSGFDENILTEKIMGIKKSMNMWKKPKISIAGQSDTGKSTLINALLGSDTMPAKWTPTTSIVVYIKHISDRPEFMSDDVWIFGKKNNELWDETKLSDENYCREYLLAAGDFSLLESYGTHQHETSEIKEAFSAVAFVDSQLLENCDLLDLPGFGANNEDDALHEFSTMKTMTDVLIYMSRSNGFLQDRDIDYLNLCINSLKVVETPDNNIDKLENLFIIAAQAGAINGGNVKELNEIIDAQCEKLCKVFSAGNEEESLLPRRTAISQYCYCENDIRKRFFTYEKTMPRLSKKFVDAFTLLIEKMPVAYHDSFVNNLYAIVDENTKELEGCLKEYEDMISQKDKYVKIVREIKDKEPGRQAEQSSKNEKLKSYIETLKNDSKHELQICYDEVMCEEYLISMIDDLDIKNKKGDKQNFVSAVSKLMGDKAQKILESETQKYTKELELLLDMYNQTLNSCGKSEDIEVAFDTMNCFAVGLTSLGVVGASATWLATSGTALVVTMFPEYAFFAQFAAFAGVVGIGIAAAIAGVIAIVKASTWKKSLAKDIIKSYEDKKYVEVLNKKIDDYWNDTRIGFQNGVDKIENDWANKIKEYEKLADEKNIPILISKVKELNKGLDFFMKMPLPEK